MALSDRHAYGGGVCRSGNADGRAGSARSRSGRTRPVPRGDFANRSSFEHVRPEWDAPRNRLPAARSAVETRTEGRSNFERIAQATGKGTPSPPASASDSR